MFLIYNPQNGQILDMIYKRDYFSKVFSINIEYEVFEIDEVEENKEICKQLSRNYNKRDNNNLQRYYIQNGELFERDGWIETEGEII